MSGGVTWADLGLSLLVIVGLAGAAGGFLVAFGAGMASAPSAEDARTGRRGCIVAVLGLVLAIGSCVAVIR